MLQILHYYCRKQHKNIENSPMGGIIPPSELWCMTLFVYHFLPPCEASEDIASLYLCQFFDPSVCLCTVWPFTFFTFTRIFHCDQINFGLSVISTIILQFIQSQSWSKIADHWVMSLLLWCVSLSRCLYFRKISMSYSILVGPGALIWWKLIKDWTGLNKKIQGGT